MSMREDKPRAYFAKLLDTPENEIDYREIPATAAANRQDAEVLLPVTAEEFHASSILSAPVAKSRTVAECNPPRRYVCYPFKRDGADGVLTYFAVEAAKRLKAG